MIRKAFVGLGVFFAVIVLMAGILLGSLSYYGARFDTDSKKYVDDYIPILATSWDLTGIEMRSTDEMRARLRAQSFETFRQRAMALGRLVRYEGSRGEANMDYTIGSDATISASYVAVAQFEHGVVEFKVGLARRAGEWQIEHLSITPTFNDSTPSQQAT